MLLSDEVLVTCELEGMTSVGPTTDEGGSRKSFVVSVIRGERDWTVTAPDGQCRRTTCREVRPIGCQSVGRTGSPDAMMFGVYERSHPRIMSGDCCKENRIATASNIVNTIKDMSER